ncbi:uncharacterized protein LOC121864928 [Homarus americanus]|uniref:uncharacterized protein LOC121864928 n=1 Tax=Homarus americanus TaxID=6706 RepID=UPI001C448E3F|nr:uncharacterized protein LOC121864928 [Homarus americanus]XP_042220069.1 uncharacterized protein LOC121864928 [Homarus americanus]
MWWLRIVVAVVVVVAAVEKPGWQPRFLGQTALKHAAFTEAYISEDETLDYLDRWTIYISTFDPFGGVDNVYRMRSPGRYLDDVASWQVEVMDNSAFWPNNPDYLPSSIGGAEGVIWSSGFLVPGKTEGQLQMYNTTKDPVLGPYNIASKDTLAWSYHRVVWKDMDVDGDLDALTARFHQPLIGSTKHDLLWFENTGAGFSEGWPAHVVSSGGPDVHFALVTLSAGGRDYHCIVVGEFFNEKVSIYWTESETNDWTDLDLVKSRVINEKAGQVFDVLVDDFNRDGVLEFCATEFRTDLGVGQVTVYFFPDDFRTDEFPHLKIADGFRPNQVFGSPTMSPGTPKVYYPSKAYADDVAEDGLPHKPFLLVSGDDDGRMYVLYPNTEDRNDWVYQKHILVDTEMTTIGKMTHGDFNGDGYEEVVVAGYTIGQLYVYTYAP